MNKVQVINRLPVDYDPASMLRVLREMQATINLVADGYVHTATSVSTSYTASLNDSVIIVDTTGGNRVVTLPRADEAKDKKFTVKKADGSANTVTVQGTTGNIDGAASYTTSLTYESVDVVSDGTNYWIV